MKLFFLSFCSTHIDKIEKDATQSIKLQREEKMGATNEDSKYNTYLI